MRFTLEISFPSIVIVPDRGFKNVAANPAMVDFPEPELPTKATTEPDFTSKFILCKTSLSSSYAKETSLKIISP